MKAIKAALKNTVLLIVSIFFAFLFLEGLARYIIKAWPFEQPTITYNLTSKDKNLRWRFGPGSGLNSLGLRNREIGRKRANSFRILYLGDSLVWSGETSSGALYTQTIESNLNEALGYRNTRIEVINAGIPGYTTYQEVEFLKQYGLDMQPDLVILGFVFNDLYYKYLSKPTKNNILGREPEVQLNRFNTDTRLGAVFARSYVAHRVYYALENILKKLRGYPYFPFEYRTDFCLAWKKHGWKHAKRLIKECKDLLEERKIKLILVMYPMRDQVDDRYLEIDADYVLYPQKRVKEICSAYDIHYFDLTIAIHSNGGIQLYRDYLHFNEKGNDIVAAVITDYLIANWTDQFYDVRLPLVYQNRYYR